MISSISWVPAGIADPNPKKYEISPIEQQIIQQMQVGTTTTTTAAETIMEDNDTNSNNYKNKNNKKKDNNKNGMKVQIPQMLSTSHLPPELRMDDYSDDDDSEDDDDDNNNRTKNEKGMSLGKILLCNDEDNDNDRMDDDDDNNIPDDEDEDDEENLQNYEDDEYDSDDDLRDVPDTREYMPMNIEALQAMNIGGGNNNTKGWNDGYNEDNNDDDDSTEIEDTKITNDDAIILVAKTEDDFPTLEVHVYDTKRGNLYVHHDIALPAFPLCIAHGQVLPGGKTGNYCAIGTFLPGIEIWNLDILNPLEPSCILGGENTSYTDELLQYQLLQQQQQNQTNNNSNKKKNSKKLKPQQTQIKSKNSGLREGSHTDAVLSLSWNTIHAHVLASGSADKTVKLWDITSGTVASTLNHHTDKVQAVVWNPVEPTLLATGSYDKSVSIIDARDASSSSNNNNKKTVKLTADCEAIAFDPTKPELLTVISEDGILSCWDVRNFTTKKPLWTLLANEYGGINDLSYNPNVPGFLATCSSINKTVSLWDTYTLSNNNNNKNNTTTTMKQPVEHVVSSLSTSSSVWNEWNDYIPSKPTLLTNKDMCAGKLYSVSFYPSSPWLLACGGSGNQLSLWDLSSEVIYEKRFQQRMIMKTNNNNNNKIPTDNKIKEGIINELILSKQQEERGTDNITENIDTDVDTSNNIKNNINKKKKNKKKSKQKIHKKG